MLLHAVSDLPLIFLDYFYLKQTNRGVFLSECKPQHRKLLGELPCLAFSHAEDEYTGALHSMSSSIENWPNQASGIIGGYIECEDREVSF